MENPSILHHCPLFDGIRPEDAEAMLTCLGARERAVSRGETILRAGDRATHMGIVLRGAVRLERDDYYGNRSIVAHMVPGQLFGETYACAGTAALPVSATADEDGAVMLLDCSRVTTTCCSACAFHNRVIFNLLRLVATKNLVYDQKIQIISRRSTREKLMTYLLSEAKQAGTSSFSIPYDRQALADYLEVERSGLSAEISKLRREGVLKSVKNHFTLL